MHFHASKDEKDIIIVALLHFLSDVNAHIVYLAIHSWCDDAKNTKTDEQK